MKMDFLNAVKALKEGKKIRRPCWVEKSCWSLGRDESISWVDSGDWSERVYAIIHLNQIFATDWEIVEEKKTLSDKELMYFSGAIVKIQSGFEGQGILMTKDVKEHLKEFINWIVITADNSVDTQRKILPKAKEIFGEELIGGKQNE